MLHSITAQSAPFEVASAPLEAQPARSLWQQLVSGSWVAQSWAHTSLHCSLRVRKAVASTLSVQELGRSEHLRHTLLSGQQKVVAATERTSLSTISDASRQTLVRMGFHAGLLSVPYVLVYAAHAAGADQQATYSISPAGQPGESILRIERPDLHLHGRLTPSELNILEMLLDGRTPELIAKERRSSTRTIANQLSAIFRKLRTSGRLGTLCALAKQQLALPTGHMRLISNLPG